MQVPEHNFDLTSADWERAVFDAASHFLVVLSHGQGRREVERFERHQLLVAMERARTRHGAYGRRPTVHAVTAAGRSITLDRAEWKAWTRRWRRRS